MKTEEKDYPNFETMCRLCLKENSGMVCIFTNEGSSDKFASLSIPTRIMTCAALEVQRSDALPKKICSECRLQLEKTYHFRKLIQESDAKLRKHFRLIGMGKISKVFDTKLEDDDDEFEYQDSLNFIREQEEEKHEMEKLKIDSVLNKIKLQNKQDLQKMRENLKETCRQELIPQIREELRKELQSEIANDLEDHIRKEVTEQCIREAKESLRTEVKEECRQFEIKCLLEDLQTYLTNKKKLFETNINDPKTTLSLISKNETSSKIKSVERNSPKIEVHMDLQLHHMNAAKGNIIAADRINVGDQHTNDEEFVSEDNFLIYDTEDGLDVQKKTLEDKMAYEDNVVNDIEYEEEIMDSNYVTYEKDNEEIIDINEETEENTSTTSYQIEDNEDGEIKLLKKSNDDINNTNDTKNPDKKNEYKNIMVINIGEGIKNDYVEYYKEDEQEHAKSKSKSPKKNKKTTGLNTEASKVTRTKSLITETRFLAQTYVNPMQRCTDTPKIFKCNDCPIVFSTKTSLERHLRSHRKVEKTGITFQCPECLIVVSCSSALRRHMYVHCKDKPFACNVCDKAFVQKEILKRHMQTHTGIKPHPCPHCDRSFAQRINLTQHINRTHLAEPQIQQHSCYFCPKRFNHASGLSRHLVSHGGVAFQCSECDRTFGDRSSIRRHIANMHNNTQNSSKRNKEENP